MRGPATRSGRGRSIGAVLAGFLVTAGLSLATDAVMHATGVFPGWGQPMSDGLFVWATAYRVVFTVIGGYVTARLAPPRAMSHVLALGIIGSIAAAIGVVATWNAGLGPRWYPLLILVTAMPCVWAGGRLRRHAETPRQQTAASRS